MLTQMETDGLLVAEDVPRRMAGRPHARTGLSKIQCQNERHQDQRIWLCWSPGQKTAH